MSHISTIVGYCISIMCRILNIAGRQDYVYLNRKKLLTVTHPLTDGHRRATAEHPPGIRLLRRRVPAAQL